MTPTNHQILPNLLQFIHLFTTPELTSYLKLWFYNSTYSFHLTVGLFLEYLFFVVIVLGCVHMNCTYVSISDILTK